MSAIGGYIAEIRARLEARALRFDLDTRWDTLAFEAKSDINFNLFHSQVLESITFSSTESSESYSPANPPHQVIPTPNHNFSSPARLSFNFSFITTRSSFFRNSPILNILESGLRVRSSQAQVSSASPLPRVLSSTIESQSFTVKEPKLAPILGPSCSLATQVNSLGQHCADDVI